MKRNINPAFLDYLKNNDSLTICYALKVITKDNIIRGYTNNTDAFVYEGILYDASLGLDSSEISQQSDGTVSSATFHCIIDGVMIKTDKIDYGQLDSAQFELFVLNYNDFTMGKIIMQTGFFGVVSYHENSLTVELRSLTQSLNGKFVELCSERCRANLGDNRCRANLVRHTVQGAVIGVIKERLSFVIDITKEDNYFTEGIIKFTTGNNAELQQEIKTHFDDQIILYLPMLYPINIGDQFIAVAGCNKHINTCREKFNNILNFRGEPHVPGLGKLFMTSATAPQQSEIKTKGGK